MPPTEWRQLLQLAVAFVGLGGFGWLYALGGRAGSRKWVRRFVAAVLLASLVNGLAAWSRVWSPWMLGWVLVLPASLHLGYGAFALWPKLRRRALYGLAVGSSSAFILWPLGLWTVWIAQGLMALSVSVFLGVSNPTSAVAEEGAIGVGLVLLVPFMVIR